ncbi:hypothetical protein VPHD199_0028 [Vibrio phage D199]
MTDRYFSSVDFAGSDSGGGAGFTLGPAQNVFTGSDRAAAEAARNTFLADNPSWLATYNADTSLNIRLEFTEGTTAVAVYQIRNDAGNGWLDNESFEALRGAPGEDGQADLTSVTNGRVPFDNNGTLADSPIRLMPDGTAFIQGITRVEGGTIAVGPFVQISERGGFIGITNALGDEFTLVDFRSPRDEASSRPRFLALTEAENNFQIQTVQTESLTSPVTFNYDPTLLARSNAFIGQVGVDVTNLRFRIIDVQTGNVFKYFPSEAAWLDNTGVDFAAGEMTLDFGDTELPLAPGRQLGITILFDSGSLLGDTNGIPALTSVLQRGQFTDLAYTTDIPTLRTGEETARLLEGLSGDERFDYSSLRNTPTIPTNTNDFVDTLTAEVSGQNLTITLGRTGALADLTQTVTLPGGGTTPPQADHTNYIDVTSDALATTVNIATAVSSDDLNPTVTLETFTGNRYIQILQSMAHTEFTSIVIAGINQKGGFTVNENAITLSGQAYRQYVTTNMITDALSGDVISMIGAV